eukprot:6188385-Pleurochrysis_carterae.AAC.2
MEYTVDTRLTCDDVELASCVASVLVFAERTGPGQACEIYVSSACCRSLVLFVAVLLLPSLW